MTSQHWDNAYRSKGVHERSWSESGDSDALVELFASGISKHDAIIDIGGGTTGITVIALAGIVCDQSIRIAGDEFTADIMEALRRYHSLLIGERTAEQIKINVGAAIPDITIAGKTGTAQNPQGEDHSVFIAFAPKENPQIAIAVYVENAGWGGRAAASTASLMIEKYIRREVKRLALEEYVLVGKFM